MTEETTSNSSSVKTQVPIKPFATSPPGTNSMPSSFAPNEQTVISKRAPLPAPSETLPASRPAQIGKSLEGQHLGQFTLEEFVGGGGMGAVFRAVDTTLDRIVAVKVVSNDQTDEDTLRRFRNEAQSAARLDHPNIARVYSVGEEGGWNYIVFEFIEGVNVRDLVVHKGPLPLDEAVSYIIQVADALEHASQRDVVHRDIKPSNLLVMQDGRAKLVDMGLARLHQVESSAEDLTATGVTLGTFDYISPEQARDPRDTDVRSDLYSLGCTFYYMLTGMPPFPEGTVLQKLLSHSSEPPPDPRDLRADLPAEVSVITMKLMAKIPTQRYQRPAELTLELMRLCESLGLVAPQAGSLLLPTQESTVSKIAVHLPWLVPVCLLVAIVFGVDALLPKSAAVSQDRLMPPALPKPLVMGSDETVEAGVQPASTTERPTIDAPPPEQPKPDSEPSTIETITTPPTLPATAASTELVSETTGPVAIEQSPLGDMSAVLEVAPATATLQVDSELDMTLAVDVAKQVEVGSQSKDIDANVMSPAVAEVTTTRIVVRPEVSSDEDVTIVRTLEAALKRAANDSGIRVIELQFNRHTARPLIVDLRNDLTIEAGEGFTPLLVFDRMNATSQDANQMLRLLGGSLTLRGVHLYCRLPYSAEEDWALLDLKQVRELHLEECTFTLQNDYAAKAAFLRVQSPRLPEMPLPGQEANLPPRPSIIMDSCIARGAATFITATSGLPFTLEVNNALVVTSERFVELSDLATTIRQEIASVTLREATIEARLGLCRATLTSSDRRLPQLLVDAEHCLVDHNPGAALIEHIGVTDAARAISHSFKLRGQFNRFPQTEMVWRLVARDGQRLEILWDERTDAANSWYEDGLSERFAQWASLTRSQDTALHKVTIADYRISDDEGIGFRADQLPELPTEPSPNSE